MVLLSVKFLIVFLQGWCHPAVDMVIFVIQETMKVLLRLDYIYGRAHPRKMR